MSEVAKAPQTLESVTIRFAGDSGDGMQLTGTQFTETSAVMGNDLSTFPDFPSEIRAPAGTLAGVSGFQLQFSSQEVHTHGDAPDVLVAMNPAALKVAVGDLKENGIIIVDRDAFTDKNMNLAGYESDPFSDGSLAAYRVFDIEITKLTLNAIQELGLPQKQAVRCKNFFALGTVYWLFSRELQYTESWIESKFGAKTPSLAKANKLALNAGYNYGLNTHIFPNNYVIAQAPVEKGLYRKVTGNEAVGLGAVTAAELAGVELFLGSYPITPASEILHFLSHQRHLGVKTFQAEDEIAGICSAIGASYAGAAALTTTSGPGLALKTEAMGLATILEIPLVIVNVQRGGPSTGLPTKTEQSDLFQSLFARNGDSPMPVLAATSPGDCFWATIEAFRVALRYMTPVVLLTDGYLAQGSAPWKVPQISELEKIPVEFATDPEGFQPYARNEDLSRPWAIPGTPGMMHRVGGLEKQNITGHVSHDPANHQVMSDLRAEKIRKVQDMIPATEVYGDADAKLAVVGWGGSFGAIRGAVDHLRAQGVKLAHIHPRFLNPLPKDLGEILAGFDRILLPELNMGQLAYVLRANYGIEVARYNKLEGKPFKEAEIVTAIRAQLEEMG
ncbi:2-oxoacid:acceptor oxidoreductase subunit alpha [Myxococcota bacterium]|nr:2-oxoacid:acceptor oxidoreductase subunit alpha [Myxococcota bacterium]MBU1432399.1 2-oxoacid:acceptor oxidoreductase subunit alpha [Myxococcota bacterium]MBU1899462.1 2-oxoacid:acceptor oxidoreductase subunit alpha [Myxococcota bacterium]